MPIYDIESDQIIDVPVSGENPVIVDMNEPEVCTWRQGMFSNMYETECGHDHYLENGTATEYGFIWCTYCGKPIKDIPYSG